MGRQWVTAEMLEKQSKVGNTWCLGVDESKWSVKSVPVVSLVQLTARHVRPGLDPQHPYVHAIPPLISSFNNQILSEREIDCWVAKIITSI